MARGAAASRVASPLDRRLVRESRGARGVLAASVALGLVTTAGLAVQALALASLLASAMPGADHRHRLAAIVWLAAATALRGACALGGEIAARLGAAHTKAELRARLAAAALQGATGAEAPGAPGELATLAGRGLDALDVYLGRCLPDLILAAVAPAILVVVSGARDWVSAGVLAVTLVLFPVFGILVGRATLNLAGSRWRQVEALGRHVTDVFQGLPILRAFGRSAQERAAIEEAGEALRLASMATLRTAFLSALVLDTLASVSVGLVAVPLGLRLLDGSVHLSAALAVLILAPEVFLPLRRASAEFHESAEGLAAWRSAAAAIDAAATPAATAGAGAEPAPDPAVVPVALNRVTVTAPGRERPVLASASLTIEPGEVIALVGPNGSGKSTMLSVLLGFRSPSAGSVTVGGLDLGAIDQAGWRARIAYLPERPTIVAGTLADNLRLANPDATEADLRAALAAAGAERLLDRLPDGLHEAVGEGGRPLSAGERQRVALARTLLRHASLYLLDEPTVHLDQASEARVMDGLRQALTGCSALIVTHRPAVLALADRVLEIRDGAVVPAGPATMRQEVPA